MSYRKQNWIPIIVHSKEGDSINGFLHYREKGPVIYFESGIHPSDSTDIEFSFIESSLEGHLSRPGSTERIILDPEVVVELNYSPIKSSHFQIYPPSTNDWLSHVVDDGVESIFTIQGIKDSDKKLLTIIDKNSSEIYHIGLVHSYEPAILSMKRDRTVHNEILHREDSEIDIFSKLKHESVSWSTLSKLVEGVTIPGLSMLQTKYDTLAQLVPTSFPSNIRNQLIAFLGWLENAEVPTEDPLDFVIKYRSVPVYRVLVRGHTQCMIDNEDPPQYVRIMQLADRKQLEFSQRPHSEVTEQDPWTLMKLKLIELFPSWMGDAVETASTLQSKGEIITELPISKEEAKKSEEAWSRRFAMAHHGLFLRAFVLKESIGLMPAIYMGAAHRWPHKHLEWSARLGYGYDKPQYIQILLISPTGFERLSRIMPNIQAVDWEMSSVNPSLFSESDRMWKIRTSQIVKSIERKRSIKQLRNEFGTWKGKTYHKLSLKQARILDLASWGMYLSTMESEQYARYYGLQNSDIKKELENLIELGILKYQYFLILEKVISLCILASGPSHAICSLSRAFLKHTPSSHARIMNDGKSCVVISRVPQDQQYDLVTQLNQYGNDNHMTLRFSQISAYAGYRNNLYSRLLNHDGTWDDDLSGLLNQVRLSKDHDK